ncbi:MAG: hypothetical protein ABI843_07145 [Dokdonella sp.]
MTVRAPDLPGLSTLNLPQDGSVDAAFPQGGVTRGGQGRVHGLPSSANFDGEAVLAADVWGGSASRTLPLAAPSAYANGPDLAANIERDVDYILSPLL